MSNETLTTSQNIADQLHSAAIHLLRKLRKEDEGSGLNAPRLSALSVVVFGGPLTLGDLAAAEQVRPPSMTRIVKVLESQGFITRATDESDRRVAWLRATPTGEQVMSQGRSARVGLLAGWLRPLSRNEHATLNEAGRI